MKKFIKKIKRFFNKKKYNKKRATILMICVVVIIVIILVCGLSVDRDWVQTGYVVSRNDESYIIGDYYEYDESYNGKYDLNDVKWRVMGVDENGDLLIVSSSSVEMLNLGHRTDLKNAQDDYISGSVELNKISEKYGKGKNAKGARSITKEDIINVIGLNTSFVDSINIEYTYYWNEEESEPKYSTLDNGSGFLKLEHYNNFYWFDEVNNKWVNSKKDGNYRIAIIKNNLTAFNNKIYNEKGKIVFELEPGKPYYKMFFLNDEGLSESYWTNNRFANAGASMVAYGYNAVKGDSLNYAHLVYSNGSSRTEEYGVRVVVTID